MADRDAWWTVYLKHQIGFDTPIDKLVNWAWSELDKIYVSDDSIFSICLVLAWCHTSTNRKLRDYCTKAMISILTDRLETVIRLLKAFEKN